VLPERALLPLRPAWRGCDACDPLSGLAFVIPIGERSVRRLANITIAAWTRNHRRTRCGAGLASGLPCHGCLHKYIPSLPAFIGSWVGTGSLFVSRPRPCAVGGI
jgi:hypothetical protein